MKKILSFVFAVILLVSVFSGCGKDKVSYAGMYEVVSCYYEGEDMGLDGEYVQLEDDGTGTLYYFGEYDLTYKVKDGDLTITIDGYDYYGTISGDIMTLDIDDLQYTYSKGGNSNSGLSGNKGNTTDNTADDNSDEVTATDDTEDPAASAEPAAGDIGLVETVIYDQGGVKVTAVSAAVDDWGDLLISFNIVNDTDADVLVNSNEVIINGFMVGTGDLYSEVSAGNQGNDELTVWSDDLAVAGITTVADLEISVEVCDPDTWDEIGTSDLVAIKTANSGYSQPGLTGGTILAENSGVKVYLMGAPVKDDWGDYILTFYIENNSGKYISVSNDDTAVNGTMLDFYLWADVPDGKKCVTEVTIWGSDLEDNNITSIDEIQMELDVDDINWDDIFDTDTLTIQFS